MVLSVNLRSKINSDGSQTLRIRVTHKRKSKFISLFPIQAKYFNKKKQRISKSHHKVDELNLIISSELNNLNNKIEELRSDGRELSLENIFDSKGNAKSLNYFLDQHIEHLTSLNKRNSARKYQNLKDKIEGFSHDPMITDINKIWIEKFYHHLEQQSKINSKETINKYIKFLKTILRKAIDNNQEVNPQALNYKLPKAISFKTKLSIEEITRIANLENPNLALAKDTFMLQFHTRGTRVSDVLKLRSINIQNNKLIFKEQKTGKKKQVEINEQIQTIINRYKGQSQFDYLLPWMDISPDKIGEYEFTKKTESKTAMLNKQLKLVAAIAGIDKKLTSHVSRHSYAHICLKEKVDLGQISDLLNHSSPRSTQAYLKSLINEDELSQVTNKISNLIG